MRIRKHHRLNGKFNIDHAASVMFDIKKIGGVGMPLQHSFSHFANFGEDLFLIARQP